MNTSGKTMNTCPECGADPFKTYDYDKMFNEKGELSYRFKQAMAQHGLLSAQWVIKEIELTEAMKYLQRKVKKQTEAIRKLEDKLRYWGKQPYREEDTIEERDFDGVVIRGPKSILDEIKFTSLGTSGTLERRLYGNTD